MSMNNRKIKLQTPNSKLQTAVFLFLLLFMLAVASASSALELQAKSVRPFGDNPLTVVSDVPGKLTIQAWMGTLSLKDVTTETEIEPGPTEINWTGLTWQDEPVPRGDVRLMATLTHPDGTTESAETQIRVASPHPAVISCIPTVDRFHPDGRTPLNIECTLSAAGTCLVEIVSADNPDEILWQAQEMCDGKSAVVFKWYGKNKDRYTCPPGEYLISAHSKTQPQWVQTAVVTVLADPLPPLVIEETGPLIPEDLTDDAAVWQALIAPVVVGKGPEGKGLVIYAREGAKYERIASVSCRTVGVTVLAPADEEGWVHVGVWRQNDSVYTEGYVKEDTLQVIRPNALYGAVLDKTAQTLTIYGRGERLGTMLVSTGLENKGRISETNSGAYLLGTRLSSFVNDGYSYNYPIRIDGFNLIHSIGYKMRDGKVDYSDQIAELGKKASHGCVRMDVRGDQGLNAWWVWTHMGRDSKIIITDDH